MVLVLWYVREWGKGRGEGGGRGRGIEGGKNERRGGGEDRAIKTQQCAVLHRVNTCTILRDSNSYRY